jgi:hypothetical protein
METDSRILVGHVVVDRGMICVVDPTAFQEGKDLASEKLVQGGTGAKAGVLVNGFGVTVGPIIGGFGGDGVYPVYVQMDDRGLVTRCIVVFDPLPPSDIHES